jgi:hypothetical protein
MSTPKIIKKDPTQHSVTRSLILFITLFYTFAWSMQFIVIEWQYSITKDPSLGIIGLMKLSLLFLWFVCWPHSGSERKEKLISQMHFGFFSNQSIFY